MSKKSLSRQIRDGEISVEMAIEQSASVRGSVTSGDPTKIYSFAEDVAQQLADTIKERTESRNLWRLACKIWFWLFWIGVTGIIIRDAIS